MTDRYTGWRLVVPWILAIAFSVGCYLLILSAIAEQEKLEQIKCVEIPYKPHERGHECNWKPKP